MYIYIDTYTFLIFPEFFPSVSKTIFKIVYPDDLISDALMSVMTSLLTLPYYGYPSETIDNVEKNYN